MNGFLLHFRLDMQDTQNPDYIESTTGMFQVIGLRGQFATLCCWDLDDQVISGVFLNHQNDPSLCLGSIHLMTLELYRSQWRVVFCSPPYEEFTFCECGECESCLACMEGAEDDEFTPRAPKLYD